MLRINTYTNQCRQNAFSAKRNTSTAVFKGKYDSTKKYTHSLTNMAITLMANGLFHAEKNGKHKDIFASGLILKTKIKNGKIAFQSAIDRFDNICKLKYDSKGGLVKITNSTHDGNKTTLSFDKSQLLVKPEKLTEKSSTQTYDFYFDKNDRISTVVFKDNKNYIEEEHLNALENTKYSLDSLGGSKQYFYNSNNNKLESVSINEPNIGKTVMKYYPNEKLKRADKTRINGDSFSCVIGENDKLIMTEEIVHNKFEITNFYHNDTAVKTIKKYYNDKITETKEKTSYGAIITRSKENTKFIKTINNNDTPISFTYTDSHGYSMTAEFDEFGNPSSFLDSRGKEPPISTTEFFNLCENLVPKDESNKFVSTELIPDLRKYFYYTSN